MPCFGYFGVLIVALFYGRGFGGIFPFVNTDGAG